MVTINSMVYPHNKHDIDNVAYIKARQDDDGFSVHLTLEPLPGCFLRFDLKGNRDNPVGEGRLHFIVSHEEFSRLVGEYPSVFGVTKDQVDAKIKHVLTTISPRTKVDDEIDDIRAEIENLAADIAALRNEFGS